MNVRLSSVLCWKQICRPLVVFCKTDAKWCFPSSAEVRLQKTTFRSFVLFAQGANLSINANSDRGLPREDDASVQLLRQKWLPIHSKAVQDSGFNHLFSPPNWLLTAESNTLGAVCVISSSGQIIIRNLPRLHFSSGYLQSEFIITQALQHSSLTLGAFIMRTS